MPGKPGSGRFFAKHVIDLSHILTCIDIIRVDTLAELLAKFGKRVTTRTIGCREAKG